MSKARIESKWYHESPNFDLVNVDVVSIDDSFCKLALFCLKIPLTPSSPVVGGNYKKPATTNVSVTSGIEDLMAYSLDIASSDTPRLQVEVKTLQFLFYFYSIYVFFCVFVLYFEGPKVTVMMF
jgi:hypothetical protein